MHLFVDISSHGFGHLALTAPVLNALRAALPDLRLTLRTALPAAKLRERIVGPYTHLPLATDFGFRMIDATRVDLPASAAAYQAAHADWPARVEAEARFLADLAPDHVLSNISYLPLAGAARAHIPASALCCLNWADLFEHFFGNTPWAAPIHAEMLAAYTINGARAVRQGEITGSIEAGKSADFIVLDRDLFALVEAGTPEQIADTRVEQTVFQGNTIYPAP